MNNIGDIHGVFLRDKPPNTVLSNIGDLFISNCVMNLFNEEFNLDIDWRDRSIYSRDGLRDVADLLVYAGMPQFGAREAISEHELLWQSLIDHFGDQTPTFNVGCGTGYSLRGNRLAVAANMIRHKANRTHYDLQRHVLYLPRDPLSWHFLDLLGLDATLALCPSGFNTPQLENASDEIAINVVPLDNEVFAHDLANRKDDYRTLITALASAHRDARFICHEVQDEEFVRSLGAQHVLIPQTAEELTQAYSGARKVVSFRVHGTVPALLCGRPVLHFAIDGRSDLLTPYMAGGLWKYDLLRHDAARNLEVAGDFLNENLFVDVDRVVAFHRDAALQRIAARFDGHIASKAAARTVLVNPEAIATLSPDDEVILTHRRFHYLGKAYGDHSILLPISKGRAHALYGPYVLLPHGRYRLMFDCEFLGRADLGSPVNLIFDVADRGKPIGERLMLPLESVLMRSAMPVMEFENLRENAKLEFRLHIDGEMPDLELQFYGVRIRKLE